MDAMPSQMIHDKGSVELDGFLLRRSLSSGTRKNDFG